MEDGVIYIKDASQKTNPLEPMQTDNATTQLNSIPISNKQNNLRISSIAGGAITARNIFNFGINQLSDYGYDITQQNIETGLKYIGYGLLSVANPALGLTALTSDVGKRAYDRYRLNQKETVARNNSLKLNGGIAINNSLYRGDRL